MKRIKLLLLVSLIAVLSCKSVGHRYCIANGYEKDSAGYEQCTMRYESSADLYNYCTKNKGILQEGPQINSCLAQAQNIKNNYQNDSEFCQNEASNKFAAFFNSPAKEKQPTLDYNGTVILNDVIVGSRSQNDIANYTIPFVSECMSAYGWNNPSSWMDEKSPIPMNITTSRLSALNQQPIIENIPLSPVADLFVAVSENNEERVLNLIRHQKIPVNITNYQGYTALHVAARQGNYPMVEMLISKLNADLNMPARNGDTVLNMASRSGNYPVVAYIKNTILYRKVKGTIDVTKDIINDAKQVDKTLHKN